MDHVAIRYLMAEKEAKLTFIRCILLLQKFGVDVKDQRGCEN